MHNLVMETTRLGIEVKNLKMRVESLASRLEFNERRARALESVVVYGPPDEIGRGWKPHARRAATRDGATTAVATTLARTKDGATTRAGRTDGVTKDAATTNAAKSRGGTNPDATTLAAKTPDERPGVRNRVRDHSPPLLRRHRRHSGRRL